MNSTNDSDLEKTTLMWSFLDSPWDLHRDCQIQPPTPDSQLYCTMSSILGIISVYVFPVVGGFGILSNLQIIFVMLFRLNKITRQTVYLVFLAIADVGYIIIFGWLWLFPAKGLPYASKASLYFFTFNESDIGCRLHRYLHSLASCLATAFMAAAAVDRALSMFMPFRFRNIRPRSALVACIVILLISMALNLPYAILVGHFKTSDGRTGCWLLQPNIAWQFLHMTYSNAGILQTLILVVSNIGLIVKIRQARTSRAELSMTNESSSAKEISACVTILTLSAVFFATSVPLTIIFLLAFFTERYAVNKSPLRFYYNLGDIMWHIFFLQESTNWIIYMARMPSFRKATFRMIGRDAPTSKTGNCLQNESELH